MSRLSLVAGTAVLALAAAWYQPAEAADAQPQSLQQILNRLPKTPLTPQEADRLVDAKQQVPAIAAVKADLAAHGELVTRMTSAAEKRINTRMGGPASADQAVRAAATVGIDVGRMQTDPAYAAEVQARMKAMSPSELMALSAAMSQGMGMRATVAVVDPPAVQAAAEAGQALMLPENLMARQSARQHRWAEAEKKVAAIQAKYAAKFPRRQLVCDGEGGGRPECLAEEARFKAAMMPLLRARDAEVLQVEAAALEEERKALAEAVRGADVQLVAAQYGATAQEPGNPMRIANLDGHYVGEIGALADRLDAVAKRAALVAHCGEKVLAGAAGCYAQP